MVLESLTWLSNVLITVFVMFGAVFGILLLFGIMIFVCTKVFNFFYRKQIRHMKGVLGDRELFANLCTLHRNNIDLSDEKTIDKILNALRKY